MIYLGGLGDDGGSKHLAPATRRRPRSPREGPPLTYFRAAMVDRARQRVLRAPAGDRRAAAGAAGARLARDTRPSRSAPTTSSTTCARRSTSRSRSGARSRSAGRRCSATSSWSTRWRRRSGGEPPRRIAMSAEIARPATVAAGAAAVTQGRPEVAAEISLGLTTPTVVTDPSGAELFNGAPAPPRRRARRGRRRRRG